MTGELGDPVVLLVLVIKAEAELAIGSECIGLKRVLGRHGIAEEHPGLSARRHSQTGVSGDHSAEPRGRPRPPATQARPQAVARRLESLMEIPHISDLDIVEMHAHLCAGEQPRLSLEERAVVHAQYFAAVDGRSELAAIHRQAQAVPVPRDEWLSHGRQDLGTVSLDSEQLKLAGLGASPLKLIVASLLHTGHQPARSVVHEADRGANPVGVPEAGPGNVERGFVAREALEVEGVRAHADVGQRPEAPLAGNRVPGAFRVAAHEIVGKDDFLDGLVTRLRQPDRPPLRSDGQFASGKGVVEGLGRERLPQVEANRLSPALQDQACLLASEGTAGPRTDADSDAVLDPLDRGVLPGDSGEAKVLRALPVERQFQDRVRGAQFQVSVEIKLIGNGLREELPLGRYYVRTGRAFGSLRSERIGKQK